MFAFYIKMVDIIAVSRGVNVFVNYFDFNDNKKID
jgi:hypothetical protein